MKLRMILAAAHPNRAFLRVQWIVGHHHRTHASRSKDFTDVGLKGWGGKEAPCLPQTGSVRWKAKRVQDCNNSARGFGNGRVLDKQCLPNGVGALGLCEFPVFFRGSVRGAK